MLEQAQQQLAQYYEELRTERAPWEGLWRDAGRLTLPYSQFNPGGQAGLALTEHIYDGTCIQASNRLAAELLGMTVNPNSRNFEFHPLDIRQLHDYKMKQLMQYLADSLQYLLHCPEYGFYPSAHEMLVEYVRFGQGHHLIEKVNGKPRYLSCPLSQCYTELDSNRRVNSFIRSWRWSLRQLRSQYPPEQFRWPPELAEKLNQTSQIGNKIEVCHAVVPSEDHRQLASLAIFPKKYTHVIFLPEYKCHIIEVKGLDVFPMPSPRYLMMSEETYARGPGTLSLPDNRMVNVMEKTNIRAIQKAADPPMMLPRRGWLRPIDISPAALNYYDGLEDMDIKSFGIDGRPDLSVDFVDRHRMSIREIYQLDELMGPNKRAEMKEVEVLDDQEKRMRAMAPQLARLSTEWMSPTLSLLLYYFNDELIDGYDGELPDEIMETGRLDMQIKYMSPLHRAQSMLDAANVKRVLDNFWLPVAEIDPTIKVRFSSSGYTDWLQENFNLPTKIIESQEAADNKLKKLQQQQDMAMGASTSVDASKALLNVAKAQQAMPQTLPGQKVI